MKDIGIRHLKAHASDLVRQVSENHATYTITRRGHAVGVLAPPDHLPLARADAGDAAWDHLEKLMDRIGKSQQTRKSAVRELAKMRR
jgi:prevent-host-death family protein